MNPNPLLVLITGPSGCGKSTSSKLIRDTFGGTIIAQDSFYKHDFVQFPYDKVTDDHMERKEAINWNGLHEIYDLNKHNNVIIEGHIVATSEYLVEKADIVFYINSQKDYTKDRFMNRYSDNLTDEQNQMKEKYYEDYTWPCFIKYKNEYIKPLLDNHKDFYVVPPGKSTPDIILSIMKNHISKEKHF